MPLVSVVLPVRNGERYIVEAVTSILEQSYAHLELILINDGSTDGTDTLCRNIRDPRLRYLCREGKGLVASLNEGIGLARGAYIARQDADDVSMAERMAGQLAFMEAHPEYLLCGTGTVVDHGEGKIEHVYKPETADQVLTYCAFEPPFIHGSVMFAARVRSLGLTYDPAFPQAQDYDLWRRTLEHGPGGNVPELLYRHRKHGQSVSTKKAHGQSLAARTVRETYRARILADPDLLDRWSFECFRGYIDNDWKRGHYGAMYRRYLRYLVEQGLSAKAAREFWKSGDFLLTPSQRIRYAPAALLAHIRGLFASDGARRR